MIGLLLLVAILSEATAPAVEAGLATLYAAIALLALVRPLLTTSTLGRLRAAWQPGRRTARPTQAARVAEEQASRLPGYRGRFRLLDVGLILSEVEREGLSLRRARVVTLDHQGVQPYVVLHVFPEEAGRTAILRFELVDQSGAVQFVCEDEVYLHEGQNAALASHRLLLRDNEKLSGSGTWELRASVDGWPLAVHTFGVGPSSAERRRYLTDAGERRRADRLRDEAEATDDEMPLPLEELLRGRRRG